MTIRTVKTITIKTVDGYLLVSGASHLFRTYDEAMEHSSEVTTDPGVRTFMSRDGDKLYAARDDGGVLYGRRGDMLLVVDRDGAEIGGARSGPQTPWINLHTDPMIGNVHEMIAKIRSRLSAGALETMSAAGMTDELIAYDIAAVQRGSEATVLGACLNDVIAVWREYVDTVSHVASL